MICNKERFEAKTVSFTEKSIVFMLGMNFIECALLADVSGVYNSYKKQIDFKKLRKTIEEIRYFYGDDIALVISDMVG